MKMIRYIVLIIASYSIFCYADRRAEQPQVVNIFYELPSLETPDLMLRPFSEEDAEALFGVHSDDEVVHYLPFERDRQVADTRNRIRKYINYAREGKAGFWAIVRKDTQEIIGRCGLFNLDRENASAEWVILLGKQHWSQGFGAQALSATCHTGFNLMGLNRIHATAHPKNVASIRICQKLGFAVIGVIPEYLYYKGGYWDRVIMSLRAVDFKPITPVDIIW